MLVWHPPELADDQDIYFKSDAYKIEMSHEDSHVSNAALTHVRKFRILWKMYTRRHFDDQEYSGTGEQVRQEFR